MRAPLCCGARAAAPSVLPYVPARCWESPCASQFWLAATPAACAGTADVTHGLLKLLAWWRGVLHARGWGWDTPPACSIISCFSEACFGEAGVGCCGGPGVGPAQCFVTSCLSKSVAFAGPWLAHQGRRPIKQPISLVVWSKRQGKRNTAKRRGYAAEHGAEASPQAHTQGPSTAKAGTRA
jgi:hypothetical protein